MEWNLEAPVPNTFTLYSSYETEGTFQEKFSLKPELFDNRDSVPPIKTGFAGFF
jgi:hypothetical protein